MYKRIWGFKIDNRGFESLVLVYGTEEEVQEYMRSEYGYIPRYSGMTNKEEDAARVLGLKVYLAPEVRH